MKSFSMKRALLVSQRSLTFLLFIVLNVTVAFTVNPTDSLTSRPQAPTDPSCPTTLSTATTLSSSSSSTSSSSTDSTSTSSMPPPAPASKIPLWFQHQITITAPSRGCHLITNEVQKAITNDLSQIKIGLCHLFVQHTSASLTINENADPDVRRYVRVLRCLYDGVYYYCTRHTRKACFYFSFLGFFVLITSFLSLISADFFT